MMSKTDQLTQPHVADISSLKTNDIYLYVHKQIPVMIVLSLFPGLGYIFLGWLNDIYLRAVFWYLAIILVSAYSYRLYRSLDLQSMSEVQLDNWYTNTTSIFYLFFLLWGVIFLVVIVRIIIYQQVILMVIR